jgi:hypothetical protein
VTTRKRTSVSNKRARQLAAENEAAMDRFVAELKSRPGEFERFKAQLTAALEEGERDIRAGRVHTLEDVEQSSGELLRKTRRSG